MMETRLIGPLTVGAIGLGCMGMSEFYGPTDEVENSRTLDRALELGITLLDTADMYGSGANEELLGRLLAGRRARAVIATKFGILRDPVDPASRRIDGRPTRVREACEASLRRLAVDTIDLYYAHRLDPQVPVEDTVGAMADLVRAGKVRALGLSEVSVPELRRAMAVHPIAAVQSELSLWSLDNEPVAAACGEIGIAFVPYSPLGRGLLTGAIRSASDLADGDFRHGIPRFRDAALQQNVALVERFAAMAMARGATPAQLALAWLLSLGDHVVPIPGMRRVARVEENAAAADIKLSATEARAIVAMAGAAEVSGSRLPGWAAR